MLVCDGFDCLGKAGEKEKTPYDIAKMNDYNRILNIFSNKLLKMNEGMQEKYDKYMNEKQFARYFLYTLGIYKDFDDINMKPSKDNELFYNWTQFGGLRDDNVNKKNGYMTMNEIVKCVTKVMKCKCVLSQDLLILCWEYCNIGEKDKDSNNICKDFVGEIEKSIRQCLDSDYENEETKGFDYWWFKKYLENSNIWVCKVSNGQSLFDTIVKKATNDGLHKQKRFIWLHMAQEEKLEETEWHSIIKYKKECRKIVRQDAINNGIRADISEADLWTNLAFFNSDHSDYNVFEEYNLKVYLTKALLLAHKLNHEFQSKMEHFVKQLTIQNKCKYVKMAVKSYEECVNTINDKYSDKQFPSAARISLV